MGHKALTLTSVPKSFFTPDGICRADKRPFEWLKDDELRHWPTIATFRIREGAIEAESGLLAYQLDDGRDYEVETVLDLAWKIAELGARK